MLLLLALAGMTLVVLATVVLPLLKPARPAPERASFDRAVYRDQIKELERDVARGLIGGPEAQAARLEIERRLLAADGEKAAAAPPAAPRPVLAAVIALFVAGGAASLYLAVGSPGLPDLPYSARGQERAQEAAAEAQMNQIRVMVADLAERLKSTPDDLDGWLRLGQAYAVLGRYDDAAEAYDHAAKLKPQDAAILVAEAEALMGDMTLQQPMPDRVIALLKRAEAIDPHQPMALWYLGLAAAQSGRFDLARQYWQRVITAMPADSPDRKTVAAAIEAIKGK